MACRFEITLASQQAAWVPAARAALDTIDRLEAELSVIREDSAISRLNRRAALRDDGIEVTVDIDADLFQLLERCHGSSSRHRRRIRHHVHATQPLLGILQREGVFHRQRPSMRPARASGSSEWHSTRMGRTTRFEHPGIELNPGAIGEGQALDRVAVEMRRAGVTDALLSAGRAAARHRRRLSRGWDWKWFPRA